MTKISTPILGETTIEEIIPKIKQMGENCKLLKGHYPSVWKAVENQYDLEIFPKKLSKGLFDRKLEIMLLQDEEQRKN